MTANAQIHRDDVRVVPEWEFQDRLTRSMRLVGLSVGELAKILDVSVNTVGRWTNGHNMPNKATRMILADLTGVELNWLENGEAPADESTGAVQRARRDSNPKPSVLESRAQRWGMGVNEPLTVKSRVYDCGFQPWGVAR